MDTLTDFLSGVDKLYLENAVFTGLGAAGVFNSTMLVVGNGLTAAVDADDRLVYDTSNGSLYYDADGVGGSDANQIASLTGAPTIIYTDLIVI